MDELLICAGSNLIPYENPDTISERMVDMIREIRYLLPNTKLYVQSILPKVKDEFNAGILKINKRLYNSQGNLNFTLLPNKKFFDSEWKTNFDLFSKDKIHLNFKGVGKLASTYMFRHEQ